MFFLSTGEKLDMNCATVMCEFTSEEWKDTEEFNLRKLASRNLCTHFVFGAQIKNGRADEEFLDGKFRITSQ